MMWGKRKENGIWFTNARPRPRLLMIFGGDRLIYLAIGRFRLRLMKPCFD